MLFALKKFISYFLMPLPFCVGLMLLGLWFLLQFATDPNSGVAWQAHVGGFVFGAVVAALVPLGVAFVAIGVTFGLVTLLSMVCELSIFATNIITGIGLAVGIDYVLFILARYREQRRLELLDVARHLIHDRGPDVTMEDIAAASGTSTTSPSCRRSWRSLIPVISEKALARVRASYSCVVMVSETKLISMPAKGFAASTNHCISLSCSSFDRVEGWNSVSIQRLASSMPAKAWPAARLSARALAAVSRR